MMLESNDLTRLLLSFFRGSIQRINCYKDKGFLLTGERLFELKWFIFLLQSKCATQQKLNTSQLLSTHPFKFTPKRQVGERKKDRIVLFKIS